MFESVNKGEGGPAGVAQQPVAAFGFPIDLSGWETARSLAGVMVSGIADELTRLRPSEDADAALDELVQLERLSRVVDAAKVRATETFVTTRRREQVAQGHDARLVARGIASEVGLARGMSPAKARGYCKTAHELVCELPQTLAELGAGRTTEWRATLVARETGWLSAGDRAEVDRLVCTRLAELGDREVEGLTRRHAYRLDPQGAAERLAAAETERRVSIRPAPETMTFVTAHLPVVQGVAVIAELTAAAERARAAGDPRSRGQVMADTLVERVTGQASADAVPITVNLVMTDTALLDPTGPGGGEPALVDGHGPVPAPLARRLAVSDQSPVWLRRLFTRPDTGQLITMETKARLFGPGHKRFVRLRDQVCRGPFCDAPIRDADHAHAAAAGGPTSLENAVGLCEACNQAKEAPGFTTVRHPDGTVTMTTPSGRTYSSRAPDPPGSG